MASITGFTAARMAQTVRTVTSTTRPTTGLFSGYTILETDTKRIYIYDGTQWVPGSTLFVCTSTTRPPVPFEGLEIYETDTDKKWAYDGTQWVQIYQRDYTAYTPVVKNLGQSNAPATVTVARYIRNLKRISGYARMTLTGGGGGTGLIYIQLPVPLATSEAGLIVGTMSFVDSSASALLRFGAAIGVTGSPSFAHLFLDNAVAGPNTQLGNGDVVQIQFDYEASAF